MNYVSDEGDVILDMFNGSGSTGMVCLANGRHYIGIEQDKKFFDISLNRLRAEISPFDE